VIGLNHYLILSAALFCVGMYGALTSRNAIRVVICVELALNAVNLTLAAFAVFAAPNRAIGTAFVVFLMVTATAEFGLALAIIIALNRTNDIGAIDALRKLKG
jgi:NAD(P)H-quinone oxidoreductase subunit 4L